jgi:hypothetical protein
MTVTPATINFHLYQYATFSESTVLKDSDGNPIDLTGYSAFMQIRRDRDDPTALYTLTTDDGSIVLGGVNGTVAFSLPAADTTPATVALVDPDGEAWAYGLLLNNEDASPAVVDRVFEGFVFAHPSVARPD